MTPKELLIPRYKLYSTYPGCPFELGCVLIQQDLGATNNPYYEVGKYGAPKLPSIYNPENYPNNFIKLNWWEDRTINEYPEYLRDIQGEVYKLEIVFIEDRPLIQLKDVEEQPVYRGFLYLTPTTKDDYFSHKEKYFVDRVQQAESFINQNEIR
jgi:hypothetical protein